MSRTGPLCRLRAKADVAALRAPAPESDEERLEDDERDTLLQIVKVSFTENLEWTFDEGTGQFSAPVRDRRFWEEQVHQRAHGFVEGDMMRADLVIKKSRVGGQLKGDPQVTRVYEIIPAAVQVPLIAVISADRPPRFADDH